MFSTIIIILLVINLVAAVSAIFMGRKKKQDDLPLIELQQRLKLLHEQTTQLQTHLTEHLMRAFELLRGQITGTLKDNALLIEKQLTQLTQQNDQRLKEISGQVEKRLTEGFEKTTATFHDIVKRLALIDEAQKKITELSTNVVGLQEILTDKRSRGAFGEVQLSALISNVLPQESYALQYSLSNGSRVDCALFLPEPTGMVAIDSKFPLENYQRMMDNDLAENERQLALRQFKQDIKKHIQDISSKYIISNETSDGAIMFIPAEAVFAEIHAHHNELVTLAQQSRVWLASPTTLMAILTTARAVIKDDATRKQVHLIQEYLAELNKDFQRFQTRMDKLATHIQQANEDVNDVNISARKISSRFEKIEQVELHKE
jgi:DNA recombination protein RmuC